MQNELKNEEKYDLLIETEKIMKQSFDYNLLHANSYEEAIEKLSIKIKK